ncbi:MAG TPA: hypothetical protein VEQ59_01945 [Polyangiaceae bacterium]|nr:hypothetical protein [Polyangiaceae bacterium]
MLGRSFVSLLVAALLSSGAVAHAAPPKPKSRAAAAKPSGKAKSAPAKPKKGKEKDAEKDAEADDKSGDKADEASAADTSKEESLKAAGTGAAKQDSGVKVKEDRADKEGVKTYKFETVEVEGRLKSPQVIYFLRRVRAEFEAGALGHRSFLGELSDSRRSAAFR